MDGRPLWTEIEKRNPPPPFFSPLSIVKNINNILMSVDDNAGNAGKKIVGRGIIRSPEGSPEISIGDR